MATTPGGPEAAPTLQFAAPGLPFSTWGTDLPFNTKLSHPSGVISFSRVGDDGDSTSYHVWCDAKNIWPRAVHYYTRLGGTSFVFTPMSSPDAWERKYPDAHLDPTGVNEQTFPAEEPGVSRGSSYLPTPPRVPRPQQQPDPDPIDPGTLPRAPAPPNPTADPTIALMQSMLAQQQEQQRQHNDTVRLFMAELQRLSTAAPAPAPAQVKPPTFPAYNKSTPLDVFKAQVTTFMQHEFFAGCTWDVKAPGKDKESNYLRSELLRVLPIDLQPSCVLALNHISYLTTMPSSNATRKELLKRKLAQETPQEQEQRRY